MNWQCRFGEDEDDWIDFQCVGIYPSYIAKIFVESHVDSVELTDEFFMVQVKKASEEKVHTIRIDIDLAPSFRATEVKEWDEVAP